MLICERCEHYTTPLIGGTLCIISMKYLVVGLILILIISNLLKKDVWSGYFYPDKNNLPSRIEGGNFDSLEECRDWAISYGESKSIPRYEYDYECGLNCKSEDGFNVCKETLR